jgi:hypothetical protein
MQEINNEIEFENNIRQIILEEILPSNSDLILLTSKKAVDIVICRNNSNPALFFLEIKYHKNNHGRLGFGHGKGGGFQPEILKKRPQIFETNLKWIIGSEENEHYFLLDNTTLVNYLQGGQVADKFNGIQKRLFIQETGINKQELVNKLKNWLLNSN